MQLKTILASYKLASTALGLGINCRGSARCAEGGDNVDVDTGLGEDALPILEAGLVDAIKYHPTDHRFYASGDPIIGSGGIYAFFQNGANGTAKQALKHVRELQEHGCENCGSVSIGEDDGEFTVNYIFIREPYCEDAELCPLGGRPPDGTEAEQARASKQAMKCRLGEEDACDELRD